MQRHVFDGKNRIGRDILDPADVMPWTPPRIGQEGTLVQAEPRPAVPPKSAALPGGAAVAGSAQPVATNSEGYDEAVLIGRQEGFARGLEEGRRQGRAEGHPEGVRQGHEEGLAAGHAEGLQRGSDELARQLQTLASLLTHLTHALNEQDYRLEQALFNLVREIARQVIGRELKTDSAHIMQIVQQALQALPATRDNIRILVNPDDQALIARAAEEDEEAWRVIASPDISPGGCRVETDHSAVDFTVEQRFSQVIEQICANRLAAATAAESPAATQVDQTPVPPGEQFQQAPEPVAKPLQPEPAAERRTTLADQAEALTAPDGAGEPS